MAVNCVRKRKQMLLLRRLMVKTERCWRKQLLLCFGSKEVPQATAVKIEIKKKKKISFIRTQEEVFFFSSGKNQL